MAEMTFWDHLDELRKVLFRVVGVWFVLAIGYFIAMPYLFDHVYLRLATMISYSTIYYGISVKHLI